MDTTIIYQDLEALARGFIDLLSTEEPTRATMSQAAKMGFRPLDWSAWALAHSRWVILEYACLVLAKQTGRDPCPSSLTEEIQLFTRMIPTPLSPVTVGAVSSVINTVKCILALLYHSVPAARRTWAEHLLFLDKFWFVYLANFLSKYSSLRQVRSRTYRKF